MSGFTQLKGVFTQHELRKARSDADIKECDTFSHLRNPRYVKLLKHPKIKDAIRNMLGADQYHMTSLVSYRFVSKEDYRKWLPEEKKTGCQVIILLDDLTEENGACMYVPYTHLVELCPTVEMLTQDTFKLQDEREFPMKKKYMTGEIGDVFVYSSMLWYSFGLHTLDVPTRIPLASFDC